MLRTGRSHAILILVAALAGCSSISSTHLKRNPEACDWDKTHLHGMPITLEVPDKFKVEIVERVYYQSAAQSQALGNTNTIGRVLRNAADGQPVVNRTAQVTVENKKEIFTVDFVKPGAGQLSTTVDLDSTSQYFSEINNQIVDQTIDSITAAIGTIGGAISPLARGKAAGLAAFPSAAPGGLQAVSKTVAVGYFDVNDRHALEKIHVFLCHHLTGCAPPCQRSLPHALVAPVAPEVQPIPAPQQLPPQLPASPPAMK